MSSYIVPVRIKKEEVVLIIQDTSEIYYSHRDHTSRDDAYSLSVFARNSSKSSSSESV